MYNQTPEQLSLSKETLASVLAQDIPVDVYLIDNGSIDHDFIISESTREWTARIKEMPGYERVNVATYPSNTSPVKVMNDTLKTLFEFYDAVLGCPNDVVLPNNLFSEVLRWPQGVVAVGMHGEKPPVIMQHEEVKRVHGDVHMSVSMIRRSAYETLMERDGYFFDEGYFLYCSDCDLKMRLGEAGIPTCQLDILAWHYGGASHRLGHPSQADLVNERTHADRGYFYRKWGFNVGDPQYGAAIAKLG